MQLLLINPNTTEAMTAQMTKVAARAAGAEAEIVPVTARRGVPYIASRAEAQIAGAEVLDMIATHRVGIDAVIIAAFGDPGIVAARELFDLPVVGMAEAAVMTAALMGERFGVVTFSPLMTRWYTECVLQSGLGARFTGVRAPETPPSKLENLTQSMRSDLITLASEATHADRADVIILGGAPLAGLAPEIAPETPGLLVDPIAAATVQAMGLARLAPSYANRPGRPAAKHATGLGPALTAAIAGEAP